MPSTFAPIRQAVPSPSIDGGDRHQDGGSVHPVRREVGQGVGCAVHRVRRDGDPEPVPCREREQVASVLPGVGGDAASVVHAIAPETAIPPAPVDIGASREQRTARRARQQAATEDLHGSVSGHDAPAVEYDVRHGDPATVLLAAAQHRR
jgi:hypothetical protein